MKRFRYVLLLFAAALPVGCGGKSQAQIEAEAQAREDSIRQATADSIQAAAAADSVASVEAVAKAQKELISNFYKEYCRMEGGFDERQVHAYFTERMITQLEKDYDYICDNGPCYAWWDFRSPTQDPGDGAWNIVSIEPAGEPNAWKVVFKEGWCNTEMLITCALEGGVWKIDSSKFEHRDC